MRPLLLFLIASVLVSCSRQKPASVLSTDVLPRQVFRINAARDTVVKTAGGALLKIDKGSLSGSDVALDVKEAYSFEDVIKAGLTTQSNGRPLSSGGMIYVNAATKDVKIVKPIKVSLPADRYDAEMKLFKGEEAGGKLNWVEPKLLPDSLSPYLMAGKRFFSANCAACHAYDKTLTGPALVGLEGRGPWKNRSTLLRFTHNPADYLFRDCYVKGLAAQFNGQLMPSFPQLEETALNALYDYLRAEDLKRNVDLASRPAVTPCEDSCRRYDSVRYLIEERISSLEYRQRELGNGKEDRIRYNRTDTAAATPANAPGDSFFSDPPPVASAPAPAKVTPESYEARYYSFGVTAFGWYNIDKFCGQTEATLVLTIDGDRSTEVDVFLAVPKEKVFLRGGRTADGKGYAFDKADGKIPLPVGEKAIVFALGEKDDKILFGCKEFVSTSDNQLQLVPGAVTKALFDEQVKTMALPGVTIRADESKREQAKKIGEEIQRQGALLQQRRPKNCACDCFIQTADSTKTAEPAREDPMKIIPGK